MVQQKYNLTFSHSDHWKDMLKKMITTEEFADVTLVTDDMKQLRAHRNILSACSPVFKSILQIDNNSPNSVIYMRGVQSSEIESIMQFIYLGETSFHEERIHEFLLVSKSLEIMELATAIESNKDAKNNEEKNNVCFENTTLRQPKIEKDAADTTVTSEDRDLSEEEGGHKTNQQSNTKGTKIQCPECEKDFNSYHALIYHTKSIHEGVKYNCNQCDHQATTKSNLNAHIKCKHEGVKYACDNCGQQFSQKQNLKMHIKSIHKGVKNETMYPPKIEKDDDANTVTENYDMLEEEGKYNCNQCDHQATTQSNMTTHIKSKHEGVKYACDDCDKQFSQKQNLRMHIKSIHRGVKYACNQCDQQYSRTERLTNHIQSIHEGIKYVCNQCDYQATTQSNLTQHIEHKHEGVKYSCKQCDYQGSMYGLRSHIRHKH